MYFPTKSVRTYPQNHPKTPFWETFQCEPIIQRALRKSHVNGATKVKLYSYIGISKYLEVLGCVKIFPLRGVWGGAGPLNVNLGPHIILETTGARKFKLKTQLHVVKYSLRVQKLFR